MARTNPDTSKTAARLNSGRVFLLFSLFTLSVSSLQGQAPPRFERLSTDNGLSHSVVTCILQDRLGFLWFGTADGLNQYDGYNFRTYLYDREDPLSISANTITDILEDKHGDLWISTLGGGLNKLDRQKNIFLRAGENENKATDINVLEAAQDGRIWLGTKEGLNLYNPENNQSTFFKYEPGNPQSLPDNKVCALYTDGLGQLWVGTERGLARKASIGQQNFERIVAGIIDVPVYAIHEDRAGILWIGTFGRGLFRFDPSSGKTSRFERQTTLSDGPGSDNIWSVFEDSNGLMWLAGTEGLDSFNRGISKFSHYRHESNDSHTISANLVQTVYEDRTGVLWIATHGGGISRLNLSNDFFSLYRKHPDDRVSLADKKVTAIWEDPQGDVWIGSPSGLERIRLRTGDHELFPAGDLSDGSEIVAIARDQEDNFWLGCRNGLIQFEPKKKTSRIWQKDPSNSQGLIDNEIRAIVVDGRDNLWVGTGNGLDFKEAGAENFIHFQQEKQPIGLVDNRITVLTIDQPGRIWIGTRAGANRYNPETTTFETFLHQPGQPESLSAPHIMAIFPQNAETTWIGTAGGGLNRLSGGVVTVFDKRDGLSGNSVFGIMAARQGYLWLSTNNGLSRLDPTNSRIRNYDIHDGLQANAFLPGSFFRGSQGVFYFGGPGGLNLFRPEQIRDDLAPPEVGFTGFTLYNREVATAARDVASPLNAHINLASRINLAPDQKLFSIEFTALRFNHPDQMRYAYKMDGLHDQWILADVNHRSVTYGGLPYRRYVFHVKAANEDGVWNEQGSSLEINLEPPIWKRWWALTIYYLSLILALAVFINTRISRERALAQKQHMVARRLREVDRQKDDFLANTAHELRTPLNGIVGLAASLRDGATGRLSPATLINLEKIISSGQRLLRLVDDIMDFSRIRTQSMTLEKTPLDLRTLTDVVLTLATPLMGRRDIALLNEVPNNIPPFLADENRLQQVLLNLIENAVRATDKGWVKVTASQEDGYIVISVIDTGIGIARNRLPAIAAFLANDKPEFERFDEQTGLGLVVARELVELHGGRMGVESILGEGSTFTFSLPFIPHEVEGGIFDSVSPIVEQEINGNPAIKKSGKSRFSILIVDDDHINRQVLINHLALEGFNLVEANDGLEAMSIIEGGQISVDLILLDIMMPRMSGYEVCRQIRRFRSKSELPIIFLSAKSQSADIVTGFEMGGNDYLTKPVAKEEMISRVRTHIELLDINRTLETKVAERTEEIHRKNQDLEVMNHKLQDANRILEEVSLTDPLTGLVNRRYIYQHMDKDVAMVRRNYEDWLAGRHEEQPGDLIFMYVDLDRFKKVNDTYGHAAGDRVLIEIRKLMQKASRELDILARWGGEEFLFVSRNTDRAYAEVLAERLRCLVEAHPFPIDNMHTIHLTCSIGYACYPFVSRQPGPVSWETVLEIADMALYAAKNSGRNCWVGIYAADRANALEINGEISQDMKTCMASGAIRVTTSAKSPDDLVWQ